MPAWIDPIVTTYTDPWTTPAAMWLAIIGIARLCRVKGRTLAVVAAATAVGIALWKAWAIGPPLGLLDLGIYVNSADAWAHGSSLFSYHSPRFNLSATYPPIGIVAFALLAPLSDDVREVLYTAISLTAIGVTARCASVLAGVPRERRLVWSLWAMSLAIMTVPVWLTLRLGQVNSLLWLLVVGDVVLIRRRSRFAGIGIGAAAAIKLIPGVFILWVIVTGLRRPAIRAIATTVGLTAFGWILAPSDSRTYWTDLVWNSRRVGALDDPRNNSMLGAIAHVLPEGTARTVLWALLVVGVLTLGLWRGRVAARSDDLLAAVVIIGCTGTLISPISWTHHLGYLVLALAVFVPPTRDRWSWAAFALCWVVLVDPGRLGDDALMSFVRMLLTAAVVVALPILPGRSHTSPRLFETDALGDDAELTQDEPDRQTGLTPAMESVGQTASAPSSRSTNS